MSLKKLLAITLVLAMVLSFMPTYAFASGDDATEEPVSEAAAEEPVVEEDPVVEEEPEAPQEEPETWDAPEDVLPEEPVEEAEVGASGDQETALARDAAGIYHMRTLAGDRPGVPAVKDCAV